MRSLSFARVVLVLKPAVLMLAILLTTASPVHAQSQAQPPLPVVTLSIGGHTLHAEIAKTGTERYMGLSFRESLAEDAGMLFVYPGEQKLVFTMRNTLLPLSIAFIDSSMTIREIVDMNVGPDQLFPAREPAQFALEVNQGWFERHDVDVGTVITLH